MSNVELKFYSHQQKWLKSRKKKTLVQEIENPSQECGTGRSQDGSERDPRASAEGAASQTLLCIGIAGGSGYSADSDAVGLSRGLRFKIFNRLSTGCCCCCFRDYTLHGRVQRTVQIVTRLYRERMRVRN